MPAAWIVIVGMAFVPALYAWFNIVGFWDPYSQTSHIRVAVANEDEGATKDQIGTVNVGAMLETQLKGNDQLGWHFVSAQEARAEVERGDSYAAFVIPASFSRDLTGIVDGTYVKPNIQYYVNEKNNDGSRPADQLCVRLDGGEGALREGVRGRYQYCGQG